MRERELRALHHVNVTRNPSVMRVKCRHSNRQLWPLTAGRGLWSRPMANLRIVLGFLLVGCGSGPDRPASGYGSCHPIEPTAVNAPLGTGHVYLVNHVLPRLGHLRRRRNRLHDLDGNPAGSPRKTNWVISLALFFGKYLDADIQALINSGSLLEVFDVQATNIGNAAGIDVFTAPAMRGASGELLVAAEASMATPRRMHGRHTRGEHRHGGNRGHLPGLTEPYVIHLIGARVEATIDGGQMTGRIGGLISTDDVQNKLTPVQ